MGMMQGNVLCPATTCQLENIHFREIIDIDESHKFHRPLRNFPKNKNCVTRVEQFSAADSYRIKTLKEDLLYFRGMLEMVQQQTGKTDFNVSILKSCNSILNNNYRKTHRKYIDLLNKTQAHEAEMHLRTLESELASLLKTQAFEVEMGGMSWAA